MDIYEKALKKIEHDQKCKPSNYGIIGPTGPTGPAGPALNILGSFDSIEELEQQYPTGNSGEAYIVGDELYIWTHNGWTDVGAIKGPKGDIGPTGVQGIQGIPGEIGPQGIQGPKGDPGPQGIQGIQGPPGIEGPQGIQGDIGPTGPQGNIGPMGPAGTPGTSVTILGSFDTIEELKQKFAEGRPGESYLVGPNLYVWSEADNQWKNVGQIKGPKGDQGERGMQGPRGEQGEMGPQGIQGPPGVQGPRGEQGLPGETGLQGEQGLQGPIGPQGIPGIQGPKGDTGVQGPKGEQGPQGDPGPKGDQGLKGDPGPLQIPCAFFMTANDDLDAYGITVDSNARIPIDTKIYDMNNNFTLNSDNTITFKEGGVYFIQFMVEAYSSGSALYPGQYEVIGVGLRKVDETTIYVGGCTWDYQEPVVRINAHGIVTTVLDNDVFELINTAQDTIHLVSPSSNNLITKSFFANPILTIVIQKLK